MKKKFAFFPTILVMCLMLNLLVLAVGSSRADAAAIATPGVWRNPDGAAIILQTYSNNSAIGIYTPDGKNIRAFYADKIVSGVFDGSDIPTQGKTFRLKIEFDLQTALVHLINANTGEEQLDVFSLDELALPNQDSDGIWQDSLDTSQYFLFQRYQNGGAMLLSIGSNQVAEMYYNPLAEMNKFTGWDVYNPHVAKTEFTFTSSTQGTIIRTGVDGSTKTWQVTKLGETKTAKFWGWVVLDQPVAGAAVSIYDLKGNLIYDRIAVTAGTGAFYVTDKYLPDDFRVVAINGSYNGQPLSAKIIREVHGFDGSYFYKVNDITTLIAAYQDRHPEKSFDRVKQDVTDYLRLPGYYTIDQVIEFCDYYTDIYDPGQFMTEMIKALGSLKYNDYIEMLIDDLDEGIYKPFRSTARGVTPGVVIGKIFSLLGGGGEIVGEIFNIFDQLGTEAKLEEISQKLDEVLAGIKRIETALNELKIKIATLNFQNIAAPVRTAQIRFTADYNEVRQQIKVYTQLSPAARKNWAIEKANKMAADYGELLTGIHEAMTGALPGFDPVMKAWTDKCIAELTSGVQPDYKDIEHLFSQILFIQLQGYQLQFNALNYKGLKPLAIQKVNDFLQNDLPPQNKSFLDNSVRFVFNHRDQNYYYAQFRGQNENSDLAGADNFSNQVSSSKNIFTATMMQIETKDRPGLSGDMILRLLNAAGEMIDCGKADMSRINGFSPLGEQCVWQVLRYRKTEIPAGQYTVKWLYGNLNPIVFNPANEPTVGIIGDNALGSLSAYTVPWRTVNMQCWSGRKFLVMKDLTPGQIWIGAQWSEQVTDSDRLWWYEVLPGHVVFGSSYAGAYFLRTGTPHPNFINFLGQDLICPNAWEIYLDRGQYEASGKLADFYLWRVWPQPDPSVVKFQLSGYSGGERFLTMNASSGIREALFYRILVVQDTGTCGWLPTGDLASWIVANATEWR
ncbi:MAG: hypothetical protein HQK60_14155 [Deltaproteobacteria bacterium]|nr:hypothetical protein [Deltaproteobacteria bacterium]